MLDDRGREAVTGVRKAAHHAPYPAMFLKATGLTRQCPSGVQPPPVRPLRASSRMHPSIGVVPAAGDLRDAQTHFHKAAQAATLLERVQ